MVRPVLRGETVCVADHLGGELHEVLSAVASGQIGHDLRRQRLRHFLEDLFPQETRGAVVHLGELRRDAGLKRKATQDHRTEAVDRLNTQAARGFDGPREEPPRLAECFT